MAVIRKPYDFAKATFLPFEMGVYFWRLMAWGALVTILLSVLMIPFLAGDFKAFLGWVSAADASNDPQIIFQAFGLMGKMFLKMIPVLLLIWAVSASLLVAFHRRAIFGEIRSGFPLRFGRSEFSVMLMQFVTALIIFGVVIVFYIVLIVLAIITGLGIPGVQANAQPSGALILLFFLAAIALICILIYLCIRLSATVAATVKYDRFALLEGWKASRGYFWWMFLSFLVLGVIGFIINQVVQISLHLSLLGMFASGMDQTAMEAGDFSAFMDLMKSPLFWIVAFIFAVFFQFISYVTNFFGQGVTAYIVRDDEILRPETMANI
ncbi:hypothetical protein [Robiginitomaculum antarcticum]|uniref:hypothetical protein n=1 Tax=Robiginitomaculum antarcticum TaxID=437507 RepID=UPI000370DBC7|nr:hypothetical protein [Robiginitomaculum antarcticum]